MTTEQPIAHKRHRYPAGSSRCRAAAGTCSAALLARLSRRGLSVKYAYSPHIYCASSYQISSELDSEATLYTWDASNRLTQIAQSGSTALTASLTASFSYDAFGRKIQS